MTRDEIVQLFAEWEELWKGRDPGRLASMYAVDCKVTSPIFGEITSRKGLEDSNRRLFAVFPDWHLTTRELIVDGDRVAQVFNVTATHAGEFMGLAGTGRKAAIHGVRIMRLADRLIKEEMRLYDFTLLLMQVGVLRGRPGH
jgi:predicted ester cyclase